MVRIKRDDTSFDEVSVTNLIDVLFCLLIVFMVTASGVLHSSVAIELPEVYTREKAQQAEIEVLVTKEGSIYLGNRQFDAINLESYLKRLAADRNTNKIIIKADGETSYGKVMEVMDISRISGLDSLSLAVREKPGIE